MTFSDLRKKEGHLSGLVALDRALPRGARTKIKKLLLIFGPAILIVTLYFEDKFFIPLDVAYGICLLLIAAWVIVSMLDCFYYSHYFKGAKMSLHEWGISRHERAIPFEVLEIISHTHSADLTGGFLKSRAGEDILLRLDISKEKTNKFLGGNRNKVYADDVAFADPINLVSYVTSVIERDKDFVDFLLTQGVKRQDFIGATSWVSNIYERKKQHRRWWGRDSLGRIKGIGKEWAHGETYILEHYGTFAVPQDDEIFFKKEVDEVERVLARQNGADVLLVGEETSELQSIISSLACRIQDGSSLPQIEHKRLLVINTTAIDEAATTGGEFETIVTSIFIQAGNAGHIILVIPNLEALMEAAQKRRIDVIELLTPFLSHPNIQTIAFALKDAYSSSIEHITGLMGHFERVFIEGEDKVVILRALESRVYEIERRIKTFFTYQSLMAIAESSERYFSGEIMEDKALDILDELIPRLLQTGVKKVLPEHVNEIVTIKTGIPTGEATGAEKLQLLNLEKILHGRIIGQDAAVDAISKAMRRSRSGLSDSKRPLGSFLFLGPTGVGKTETAKNLARVFFGSEDKMARFDMSEYNSFDSLGRLIGSPSGGSGILADTLREHPYCVLLLDEFEKADPKVIDLFLQVLDEGQFTDVHGKRVNARNLIIIATSNAGSDLVWKMSQEGKNPAENKDVIVDYLVQNHLLKPELINRFDGTIIFHPLNAAHRAKISMILLEELKGRLSQQGIIFNVTDELSNFVAKYAEEKSFGARPLRRFIQENIEELIARRLLEGKIKKGDSVTLSGKDLI